MKQTNLFDVLYIDSFAGGGGASTGIELATGHPVDIAINHDKSAIMMHQMNHPYTTHYREDIWAIDPIKVTEGRHVRLAWFSPDCKHFSRAKGSALVSRHIRGLAWVVLKWAGTVKPDIIMLENVPEFVTWGPVKNGKPIKSKAGQTYQKWHQQLEDLGYTIETRELCAADYGAPTIRTRFHLIARRDGKPIVWPKRTHAPENSIEVLNGVCEPWRNAADIIDWSQPVYSIFDSKQEIKEKHGVNAVRPLSDNTMRRIARGLDKFVLKSAKPFIMKENKAHCLIQYHSEIDGKGVRGQEVSEPIKTVDASNRYGLVSAYLCEYFSTGRPIDIEEPMHTVTTKDREVLTTAFLSKYYTGVDGASVDKPLPTVTAIDHNSLVMSHLAEFKGQDIGQEVSRPLRTITASAGCFGEVRTTVEKVNGCNDLKRWPCVREMLNRFCDYNLGDDEILLLSVDGQLYYIADIGLRMLTPRELYNAMGFPPDYIIDQDENGNKISRADQVARCGNAVCPCVAEALVRANSPDCAAVKYGTMERLAEAMTS